VIQNRINNFLLDWPIVLTYLVLVIFGYFNILSASSGVEFSSYIDISKPFGKQLVFIGLSLILIFFILAIEAKFYERFASIIYLLSIISLLGLFIFGKKVNGALSWYEVVGFTFQPSEFAKFATTLGLAKYVSDLQTNIKEIGDQFRASIIILIPSILILMQNDAGSTIVFMSLIFVFYREGIPQKYLLIAFTLLIISIVTLKFSALSTCFAVSILVIIYQFFVKKKKKRKFGITTAVIIVTCCISFATEWSYNNVLQKHHQDRIGLWLRLENDPVKLKAMKRSISYNLNESEKAISAGGVFGKGFNEGTRTKGKFVPEQHTDYIFSTVAEEWGFLGSSIVVILFMFLIIRIIILAEQNKSQFNRTYGYGVASIIFIHFLINIGMVMGLIPTIGIPLPFFSYGGSGLIGFTILIFIFLKLNASRLNTW
jgi:rod shape determining protein RodA